tara:strand:+ start:148 stop:603 length:456 start_codon:yes stop_codon:yes gene_type:complete
MRRCIGKALVISGLLVGQTSFAAEACIRAGELEADKIRFVETQLKVAALQCRSFADVDYSMLYSSFVKENRPFLVRSSKPLASYLKRVGEGSLAVHMSEVAKRVSYESTKVSQFCNRARLAAQFSAKSAHPVMLIAMLPVRYERPAMQCKS